MTVSRSVGFIALVLVGWALLDSSPAMGRSDKDCEFKAGELVFIEANTISGRDVLDLEDVLEREFRKRKVFAVIDQPSQADLVFLVFAEYRLEKRLKENADDLEWWEDSYDSKSILKFAEGFALTRKAYLRGFRTREDLRSSACWQWLVGSENVITTERAWSRKLVRAFHTYLENAPDSIPVVSKDPSTNLIRPGQAVYLAAFKMTGVDDANLEGMLIKEFSRQRVFRITGDRAAADFVFLAYSKYRKWYPRRVSSREPSLEKNLLGLLLGKKKTKGTARNVLASAEGIAVTPEEFEMHLLDLEKLRQIALWRGTEGDGRIPKLPKRYHRRLVKRFHEEVAVQTASK